MLAYEIGLEELLEEDHLFDMGDLEINITWDGVDVGRGKYLLSFDAGCQFTLD